MLGIALRSLVAFLLNRTLALTRDLPPDKQSLVQASPQSVPTDGHRPRFTRSSKHSERIRFVRAR